MCKLKDLKQSVDITQGFPGKYTWKGGTSYYLEGGEIHFSVPEDGNAEFSDFHITPDVLEGSNVGIWFKKGEFSNINAKNLPSHKKAEWDQWWNNNQAK